MGKWFSPKHNRGDLRCSAVEQRNGLRVQSNHKQNWARPLQPQIWGGGFQREFSRAVRASIVWERGEVGGCAARCVHQESKAVIVGMRSRCWRGISPDCSSFVFHAWTSDAASLRLAAFLAVSSWTCLTVNRLRSSGLDCDTTLYPKLFLKQRGDLYSPRLPPLLLKSKGAFFSTIYNSQRFSTHTEEGKTERGEWVCDRGLLSLSLSVSPSLFRRRLRCHAWPWALPRWQGSLSEAERREEAQVGRAFVRTLLQVGPSVASRCAQQWKGDGEQR